MYKYLPIEQAKVGDIVEVIDSKNNTTAGKLYAILPGSKNNSIGHFINDLGKPSDGINLCKDYWKLVATKPGSCAKVGDTVFCIKDTYGDCKYGNSFIVDTIHGDYLGPTPGTLFTGGISQPKWSWKSEYFVVLCKEEEKPTIRRNLAFYKQSGEPWTPENYKNICTYCDVKPYHEYRCTKAKYKYIFDSGTGYDTPYESWSNINDGKQETHANFKNCKQIAYEDIFGNLTMSMQEFDRMLGIPPLTIPDDKAFDKFFNSTRYKEDQAFLASLDYTEKINQNQKENSMNSLQQLLCQIFGAEKPTTDYDNRKQLMVIVYSLDGKMVATATADSVDQVTTEVKRNPTLWGCKVLTYKLSKEIFVDVPVSIGKAKVASESDE